MIDSNERKQVYILIIMFYDYQNRFHNIYITESYFCDSCIICNINVMKPVLALIKHDIKYINLFTLV